jgi:hypothetical protein
MTLEKYQHHDEMLNSHSSAKRIVSEIIAFTGNVSSVLDVGGGDGGWLLEFQNHGIRDILLLDCPAVKPHLQIDSQYFQATDLSGNLPNLRRYDLALCLECAEHLPISQSKKLIEWLTKTASLVVFSAAIPGQGGKGHVNEQPHSFWTNYFEEYGYVKYNILRPRIVEDKTISFWYRQNIFLYADQSIQLNLQSKDFIPNDFILIHQDTARNLFNPGVKMSARNLASSLLSAFGFYNRKRER